MPGKPLKVEYVRVCPVCGSVDVSPDLTIPAAVASGALYGYRCNECGYSGIIFPEFSVEDAAMFARPSKAEGHVVINVTYGRGYASILKFFSPILALISLLLYLRSFNSFYLIGAIVFTCLSLLLPLRAARSFTLKLVAASAIVLYVLFYRII